MIGCKKNIVCEKQTLEENEQLRQLFFKLPIKASIELKDVANEIQKQDKQFHFVIDFIHKNGLPEWNFVYSNIDNLYDNNVNRNKNLNDTSIFFIPIKSINKAEISSYIVCLKVDSVYKFKLYRKQNIDTTNKIDSLNPLIGSSLSLFALFENKINKKDSLFYQGLKKHISDVSLKFGNSKNTRTSIEYDVEVCYRITCGGESQSNKVSALGACFNCYTYTYIVWVTNSGGTAWYSVGSTGGTNSGTDENGFLLSRIADLKMALQLDPILLLPCDSLNILPLDPDNAFGQMFQSVAQFTPSQYIKSRIDSIRNVAQNWYVDNFYLTNLEQAFGGVVNCDYFPVRITQLPPNFTAESLIEYFRKHINDFIDNSLGISFSPYTDNIFSDTAKFNSLAQGSIGSLVHIHMLNDGSVIESEYYNRYVVNNQMHRFKFTTMATPLDLSHPVAGNREFGVFSIPSRPNEYTFYTIGVDRISDIVFATGNTLANGFEDADNLWTSVQTNMINFINNNGGVATFYTIPSSSTKARPQWDDVKDFLKGTIDFTTLKQKLGCL